MADNFPKTIYITIKNKQDVIFDDSASALTSFNEQGLFDILPMHENFISIIKNTIIIHKKTGESHPINITEGVLRAFENKINIYLGNKQ